MADSRSVLVIVSLGFVACAAGHPVRYSGVTLPRAVVAEQIELRDDVPPGFDTLGTLSASCRGSDLSKPIRGEALIDVICGDEVLRAALRERAAAVGGTVLVGLACSQVRTAHDALNAGCRASVAASRSDPELPNRRGDGDQPDALGVWGVAVDVAPVFDRRRAAPLESFRVHESPFAVPPYQKVASVTARCDRCERMEAEDALRSLAAHLGAETLADVRCSAFSEGWQCLADLLARDAQAMKIQAW